jgi:hypothetical protein
MDIQKTMEFILEQQAVHSVRLAVLDERLDRLAASAESNDARIRALMAIAESHESDVNAHTAWLTGISKELQTVSELMRQAMEAEARTEMKLDRLAVSQERTDARLDRLAEAQLKTEEKLQRFIEASSRPPSVQ